jgi:hypothetical protein
MKINNSKKLDQVLDHLEKMNVTQLDRQELLAMVNKPVITNAEFIRIFDINLKTAYRWRLQKLVNYLRIARRVYYQWKDVMKLMEDMQSIQS